MIYRMMQDSWGREAEREVGRWAGGQALAKGVRVNDDLHGWSRWRVRSQNPLQERGKPDILAATPRSGLSGLGFDFPESDTPDAGDWCSFDDLLEAAQRQERYSAMVPNTPRTCTSSHHQYRNYCSSSHCAVLLLGCKV